MSTRTALRRVMSVAAALMIAAVALVSGAPAPVTAQVPEAPRTGVVPLIVAIRAAHHPGFDRIVFEFDRRTAPKASVEYVDKLYGGFSGLVVPVPGRAIIRVRFPWAQAHTDAGRPTVATDRAFALPAIMALRGAGDFEAHVTLGIGVAARTSFHVHRLANPGRLAIDVRTAFRWTWRTVYFVDEASYATGQQPYERGVRRPIPTAYPATGLLDRVFAGPTPAERSRGLRFVASGATGFRSVTVDHGIARVRLSGPCSSGGSTLTIGGHIFSTLKPLAEVSWVKIYDAAGRTERPAGRVDSIPECLEP